MENRGKALKIKENSLHTPCGEKSGRIHSQRGGKRVFHPGAIHSVEKRCGFCGKRGGVGWCVFAMVFRYLSLPAAHLIRHG